ncbi:MAG: hypothetical protein SVT56_13795, partial [Chloroflexota bacterium]|nr:hypothetical protein [Chloroflexota bacterium]
ISVNTEVLIDAIAIVISEETGSISIAQGGRMIRRLNIERLQNTLHAYFQPTELTGEKGLLQRFLSLLNLKPDEPHKSEGGEK